MARSDSDSDSNSDSPKRKPRTPHEKKWNRPTRPSKHDKGFVPPAPTIAPAWTQNVRDSLDDFHANKEEKKYRIIEKLRADNENRKDGMFDSKAKKERKAAEAAKRAAKWAAKERAEQQKFVVAQEEYRAGNPGHFSNKEDRERDDRKLKNLRKKWFGEGSNPGQGPDPGRVMAPGGNEDLRQQAPLDPFQMHGALPISTEEAAQSGQSEGKRSAAGQAGNAGPGQRQDGPTYNSAGGPRGISQSAGYRNQPPVGQGGYPGPSRQSQEEAEGSFQSSGRRSHMADGQEKERASEMAMGARGTSAAPSQQRGATAASSERNKSFNASTGPQGASAGPSQQRRPSAGASEQPKASKYPSAGLPQINIQKATQATVGGVRGSATPSNAAEQNIIRQSSKNSTSGAQSSQDTIRSNQTANYKIGNMARTVVEGQVPGIPTAHPMPARSHNSMSATVASSSPTKTSAPTAAYKMGNMARTVVEGQMAKSMLPSYLRAPTAAALTNMSATTKMSAPTEAYKMGNMARTVVEGQMAKSMLPTHLRAPTAAASGPRKEGTLTSPEDRHGSLPPGWEAKKNTQGATFYVDNNTSSTHWNPPLASQR